MGETSDATRSNKMAAWSGVNLPDSDYSQINNLEYVSIARHIPRAQTIREDYFESSGLTAEYYLDTSLVFQKLSGKCNRFIL